MDAFARNDPYFKRQSTYTTPLGSWMLAQFLKWVKENKIPYKPFTSQPQDYDMPRYFEEQIYRTPNQGHTEGVHFTDEYKTPYHQTASGESRYALPGPVTPRWQEKGLTDVLRYPSGETVPDEAGPYSPPWGKGQIPMPLPKNLDRPSPPWERR